MSGVLATVALLGAIALLRSTDRPPRAAVETDTGDVPESRARSAVDDPLFGHRTAPAVALPALGAAEGAPLDARTLFGDDVVAVSYAEPAVVVTRGGTRFGPGDELPSGAVLRSPGPGRLTVIVDGVESPLEALGGDADRPLRLD